MPKIACVRMNVQAIVLYIFIMTNARTSTVYTPHARHLLPTDTAKSAFSVHIEALIIDSNHLKFQACFNFTWPKAFRANRFHH